MIDARPCILYTDHKPLIHAWKRTGDPWSGRQQRHLAVVAEAFSDVQHKEGKENVVANALSRIHVYQNINLACLQAEQEGDDHIRDARTAVTNMKLEDLSIDGCRLLCDTSLGFPRPLVPTSLRKEVFDALHGLSHPGVQTTKRLITQHYVWHRMKQDVKRWCQYAANPARGRRSTVTREPQSSPSQYQSSHLLTSTWTSSDCCPAVENYSYLLTIIDQHSRWPDAIPLKSITAKECSKAIIAQWVSRYSIPRDITSDHGWQFISEVWQTMAESLGVRMHYTTAYHPQSNGIIRALPPHVEDSTASTSQWPSLVGRLTLGDAGPTNHLQNGTNQASPSWSVYMNFSDDPRSYQ